MTTSARTNLTGVYDIVCQECQGERVILVPDEDRCTKAQLTAYRNHLQDRYDFWAEIEAERRMGA